MTIAPVRPETKPTSTPRPETPAPAAGTPFAEALSRAAQGPTPAVTPQTAAEILRLQLLNSAVCLGDGERPTPASEFLKVQGVLDAFLAQRGGEPGPPAASMASGAEPPLPAADAPPGTDPLIQKAARRYGLDPSLIKAVIKAESDFNPRAVSSAGAQGLMQLMPATARGLGVTDPFDPEQNVMAGTRFLKDMLQRYHGDLDQALAAYNWGPGNVDRRGDQLPRETRIYLGKVKGYYAQYLG